VLAHGDISGTLWPPFDRRLSCLSISGDDILRPGALNDRPARLSADMPPAAPQIDR
jgi:hypothetical protein